jgi:hypothetical protein
MERKVARGLGKRSDEEKRQLHALISNWRRSSPHASRRGR